MDFPTHPDLLVGLEHPDDAGVFRLGPDLALIQTVDFFTPVVDDPYQFGLIAAANSLSDVYAMGGEPLTAMNIICFPVKSMSIQILREVLRGGIEKVREAGAVIVGGHSVEDDEMKYGLAVTGTVHPDKILTNKGARPGDLLILTKPIGTGIINTAIKGNLASQELVERVVEVMATLNKAASEAMKGFRVRACTDVTGFGLLGHAFEMIEETDVGLRVFVGNVPVLEQVKEFASMGILPAGLHRNREFRVEALLGSDGIDPVDLDILFDPQTSGGLLIAVDPGDVHNLLAGLRGRGVKDAEIIGEFVDRFPCKISLEPRRL